MDDTDLYLHTSYNHSGPIKLPYAALSQVAGCGFDDKDPRYLLNIPFESELE